MRTALNSTQVTENYNHIAHWYDCQHSFLTGGTDEQGRELGVELKPNRVYCVLACTHSFSSDGQVRLVGLDCQWSDKAATGGPVGPRVRGNRSL